VLARCGSQETVPSEEVLAEEISTQEGLQDILGEKRKGRIHCNQGVPVGPDGSMCKRRLTEIQQVAGRRKKGVLDLAITKPEEGPPLSIVKDKSNETRNAKPPPPRQKTETARRKKAHVRARLGSKRASWPG